MTQTTPLRPYHAPRHWGWCRALAGLTLVAGLAACAGNDAGPAGTAAVGATAPAEAYPPPGSSAIAGQEPGAPYPPPQSPAAPAPAVEADGYRALPLAVDGNVVSLANAPHAEFLGQLQAQLDAGDAAGIAAHVGGQLGGLSAAPIKDRHTASFHSMDAAGAQAVLRQLFDAGSRPRIEGVHVEEPSPGSDCLAIVTSGWRDATYARPSPTGPAPAATSEMGDAATEVVVEGGEHRWDLCFSKAGEVGWEGWWWGGYGELIADMTGVSEEHPYIAVRPVGATRTVTMTQGEAPIRLAIPAGWIVQEGSPTVLTSFNRVVGRGGLDGDAMTKIDVYSEAMTLDEIEAQFRQPEEGVQIQALERRTVGPDRYPAVYAVVVGGLGANTTVALDVGGQVLRLQCFGDCTPLLPIAETIQPVALAP
jgi:hypothetical protein